VRLLLAIRLVCVEEEDSGCEGEGAAAANKPI